MSEAVLCTVHDGVCTLTLNKPNKLNALNEKTFQLISAHLDGLDLDGIYCVVLKGRGRSFCAGHDLDDLVAGTEGGEVERFEAGVIERLANLPVPVIAAVQGHCYTGGLELVLAADIIIATENAEFADTHAKWDLVPVWGLTQRLPRRIGRAKAMEMMISGQPVSGRGAVVIGLANACVPDETLEAEVARLCGDICANSRRSVVALKKMLADTDGLPLAAGLAWELHHSIGHGQSFAARLSAMRGKGG